MEELFFSPKVEVGPQKMIKDLGTVSMAVENLNLVKQGIIPPNEFDLEMIYAEEKFEFNYGTTITDTAKNYKVRAVREPKDKHADHLFTVIVNVFSEPMNCGYFNDKELDRVFSILTLSPEAQSLLVRILKRKCGWHRVNAIKYPEIAPDLTPIFDELVRCRIFDNNIKNESMKRLLPLLQLDELRSICQAMKVTHKGPKGTIIRDLLKLAAKKQSLFPGMKSPSLALMEKITGALGKCICLLDEIKNILKRIFILLIPNQDPKENIADIFFMLAQVGSGEKVFPPMPKTRFPIFRNRSHLIDYLEARSRWTEMFHASQAKDWDNVRALGQMAFDWLQPFLERDNTSEKTKVSLPSHVKQFETNYPWVKVLWKSIEGFKKTKEGIETAAKFLHTLVSCSKKWGGNPIRWYSELALIEMHHRRNLKAAAEITIKVLMWEKLSEFDFAEMSERARKLLQRSKTIDASLKERLMIATQNKTFPSVADRIENVIEATVVQGNTTGSKSTWSIKIGADVGYLKVEQVALHHYCKKGFQGGLHCEGALPITLFTTVFWNEIYEISVPGAFVSPYQEAPLDLYTSHFVDHRRDRITNKLNLFRNIDIDNLSNMLCKDLSNYRHYSSPMHGNLFENPEDFKDFIKCLGTVGLVGICERLASNYNQWKAGFPDLAIWDTVKKKCKFVEVKGPGDKLSTKQKLWIQFLESLNVDVEVCIVKSSKRKYAT